MVFYALAIMMITLSTLLWILLLAWILVTIIIHIVYPLNTRIGIRAIIAWQTIVIAVVVIAIIGAVKQ